MNHTGSLPFYFYLLCLFISVSPELIELHVKLLRKIRKSVSAEKWERALIKFCHSYYISEDGWELERSGYNKCKIPNRLRILKVSRSLFDIA